jgi:hypothetical protein
MDAGEHARAVADEQLRARRLRVTVDLTCAVIAQQQVTRAEAERLVAAARARALELFPDKGHVFALVLAPRFARLIDERFGPPEGARVPPFRRR